MKLPKTRNGWTMTEWAFWGMIRSCLRMKSRWRKPIQDYKKSKQLRYVWPNKRRKRSYRCENCKKLFDWTEVEINHIIPAGSLTCAKDLPWFVERLFTEQGFNLLCKWCHKKETAIQRINK